MNTLVTQAMDLKFRGDLNKLLNGNSETLCMETNFIQAVKQRLREGATWRGELHGNKNIRYWGLTQADNGLREQTREPPIIFLFS